jgi:hypothetical protein
MSEPSRDELAELRERLRATQEAAEKLAGSVPSQGWATASEDARSDTAAEIQSLVGVLHALRDLVPEDLWEQVRDIARQLLLLLRALLDVVVERLGADAGGSGGGGGGATTGRARGGPDLQDIPIA